MTTRIRRFVAVGDLHYPDTIDLAPVRKFIVDFKPDEIIISGDAIDLAEVSKYNEDDVVNEGIIPIIQKAKNHIRRYNRMLTELCRGVRRKIYIIGNHERRMEMFFKQHPQWDTKTLPEALGLGEMGFDVIPFGKWYRLGKLYFLHGEGYGGDFFTKKAAITCHKNLRLWHHHTNQEYMTFSPLNSRDIVSVKAVGCLCKKNPAYLNNKPNRWANSFLAGYVLPDGNFNDYVINIIDGKLVSPTGKLYSK